MPPNSDKIGRFYALWRGNFWNSAWTGSWREEDQRQCADAIGIPWATTNQIGRSGSKGDPA